MMPLNTCLFSLLFFLLLPSPALLYSLYNCTFSFYDPQTVSCHENHELSEISTGIPKSTVSLIISDGKINKIQKSDFHDLNALQSLSLIYNHVSIIEDAAFSHLPALTELSLSHNRLTDLTEKMFKGLSDVTVLDLGFNQIEFISEPTFVPLKNLQNLTLYNNSLSQTGDIVHVFLACPLLQTLDLKNNRFTSFESSFFPLPLNVSELDLSGNPLHSFTLHSDRLPLLETLHLSDISSQFQWHVSDKAFLRNLKTLDLSWTNFTIGTYQSVFKSVNLVENLNLMGIRRPLDRDLLDLACGIPSVHKLDLSMNVIIVLNNDLLQSCTNLTDLDLSINSLKHLKESSLRMLTRLSKLDLSSNYLAQIPLAIRNMSSLTSLSFNFNRISKLHCLDFAHLWQLTELNLRNNKLIELNSCVFQDLHNLKRLNLIHNFNLQFDNSLSSMLPNLLDLHAEDSLVSLQKGVFKNMSRLQKLNLISIKGTAVEEGAWDGLTDLRELSYSPAIFSSETAASAGSNSSNKGRSQTQVINLPSLQMLRIIVSEEGCYLFSYDILKSVDNLKVLQTYNFFCPYLDIETFRYTPLLRALSIIKSDDLSPDPEVFHPITHLQSLDLSQNHLKSLDFLSQANLTELQKLVLTNNDLVVINETVFEALPSLKYIDFSGNPFVCNCSNAGFIHWVLTNKQVYVNDAFSYRCAYPLSENRHLLDFDVQSCWDFPGFVCFIFSSVLVLATLLSTFTYHFLRWQLVYGFYLLRAFVYDSKKRRQGCPDVYDAFVSYNVHDEEWVYRELVPELEERQGWRLCLHHRDFEPGKAIMENITDAIYSSRKTLCVISRHYLQSEWCSCEIQMASFRLLDEQKDVLILLLLEELSSAELSPFYRVRKLLRSRTYLSWSGARSHRGLFWERVRRALQCGAEICADNPLLADPLGLGPRAGRRL